ncbi:MAG: methyltransferase C-terminal domain-containing protein, partial [Pseudomonadota bacterium]|nr:methyltransferase C-terminal domain-containing protein [Pseudomonadota bacterium]
LGKELVNVLSETKAAGKLIHIYGASTKGNVLLQLFGIGRSLIDAAAERNDWKFGHRTPGTNIPIISEAESRTQNPDYYLVLPWHFRDEFVKREKAFIDNGGKLIFPLPRVEIFPDG